MFNQVSAFLTQNNLLDSNQSGFRSGHSNETALLSVVEALRLARAESKSSILIWLDLSAAFDTVNHQILLSTLLAKGNSGTASQFLDQFSSLSTWHHYRFCHSETWLFISLLCWWHSTLPLIPSWWSDNSFSNRHFLLDEGPSPSTQPCHEPKRMHVTPLFINLHWLPIAARIKFKALMFAYKTTSLCIPLPKFITSDLCASRSLCSASERRFIVHPKEPQNHFHRLLH